jgi:hypothetical protein
LIQLEASFSFSPFGNTKCAALSVLDSDKHHLEPAQIFLPKISNSNEETKYNPRRVEPLPFNKILVIKGLPWLKLQAQSSNALR